MRQRSNLIFVLFKHSNVNNENQTYSVVLHQVIIKPVDHNSFCTIKLDTMVTIIKDQNNFKLHNFSLFCIKYQMYIVYDNANHRNSTRHIFQLVNRFLVLCFLINDDVRWILEIRSDI